MCAPYLIRLARDEVVMRALAFLLLLSPSFVMAQPAEVLLVVVLAQGKTSWPVAR